MLSLLFLLFADPHLHGVVRDSSEAMPLRGATVRVVGTRLGAVTDTHGEFHIHDVRGDSVTLQVSMVGYATLMRRVAVDHREDIRIDLCRSDVHGHDVDVVAERTAPYSMPGQGERTLSAQEIDAGRGQTFAAVLEQVPGVTTMSTGPSIVKPMIHGMTGTRLVMNQAGINQEGQQWGQEHAPEIDPFTPSRISVVKGPSGVRLGPNAMGGAIIVTPVPLRPTSDAPNTFGEVAANLFTNNGQGAVGGWVESTRLFETPVSARLQAAGRIAGDARTPDYVLGNTSFNAYSGTALVAVGNDDLGVDVYGSLYRTQLGVYAGSHLGNAADLQRAIERGEPSQTYTFDYQIDRPMQDVGHVLMSIDAHARLSDASRLIVRYGWQQNDRAEFDKHNTRIVGRGDDPEERAQDSITRLERSLSEPAMELLLTTYNADVELEHRLAENISGAAGISGLRQVNDRSGAVYLVPDYIAYGIGLWAYETITLSSWTLGGGVRFDRRWLDASITSRSSRDTVEQSKTFDGVSANIGATYNITDAFAIDGNVGIAWRPPQVNELYSNDVHHGVAQYEIGDSTLVPERSIGSELGLRWAVPGIELDFGVYGTWFNDYIYAVPDASSPTVTIRGTFPTYRYTQNDAFIGGIDLSASTELSDVVSLYLKGAIVRGINTERDEPLFLMPADRLTFGTHLHTHDVWFVHESYVDASVTGVATQTRFVEGQDYAPPPPGYVLFNLSLGGMFHIGDQLARFSIGVNNLFNTAYRDYLSRYRYYADDPGRDVIIRFTIPLGVH